MDFSTNDAIRPISDCFDDIINDINEVDADLDGQHICLARGQEWGFGWHMLPEEHRQEYGHGQPEGQHVTLTFPSGKTEILELDDILVSQADGPFDGYKPVSNNTALGVVLHGDSKVSVYLLT